MSNQLSVPSMLFSVSDVVFLYLEFQFSSFLYLLYFSMFVFLYISEYIEHVYNSCFHIFFGWFYQSTIFVTIFV